MTAKPHDALFKAAFENPEDAADLFRSTLPADLASAIAWDSLAREAGSFIDPELADRHSDLLFSVRLCGREALIYVLLEHQSTNDGDMTLRMLIYLVRIWETYRKQNSGPLPPIIPLVVSHPPDGWTAPTSFHELFDPHPAAVAGLAELIPNFSLLVEDLNELDNDALKGRALAVFPKLALWFLRDARHTPRFLANLHHWVDTLSEALRAPGGTQAVAQLFRYLTLVGGDVQFKRFRAKLREQMPPAEEIAMTFAEQLRQEGLEQGLEQGLAKGQQKGRQEGRHQGQIATLQKLLTLKFGELSAEHLARLHAADDEQLERYTERLLTADSLELVLAP